jgi:hypothetical protein
LFSAFDLPRTLVAGITKEARRGGDVYSYIKHELGTDMADWAMSMIEDIDITSSNAKVLVTDNHSLLLHLPQIAGLLCHKDTIEIHCIDCDAENKKLLKKMLKDWDLMDTIKLTFVVSTESSNHNYDLTLSDGMLKPFHKVTQIYQPSLFD